MYADIHVWFMYCMHIYVRIVHYMCTQFDIHTCTVSYIHVLQYVCTCTYTYMSCMYHVCHVRCEVYYCTIVLFYITDMHN